METVNNFDSKVKLTKIYVKASKDKKILIYKFIK